MRKLLNGYSIQLNIEVTNYTIDGPADMVIAIASDFHNSDAETILEMLQKGPKPDIILIPGDVVLGYYPAEGTLILESCSNIMPFLKGCCEIAPTYMSLGNHECLLCDEDLLLLKSTGITLLDNEWIRISDTITGTDSPVLIGGLTSGHVISYRRFRDHDASGKRYPSRRRPRDVYELRTDHIWLDQFEKEIGYKILLSHHPEYWCVREPELIHRRFDLVISGHAHGGQWRFMNHGFFSPGQGLLPKYTDGMHNGPYGKLVISRGLSNPYKKIPRWGNPCEMIYLNMSPECKKGQF